MRSGTECRRDLDSFVRVSNWCIIFAEEPVGRHEREQGVANDDSKSEDQCCCGFVTENSEGFTS